MKRIKFTLKAIIIFLCLYCTTIHAKTIVNINPCDFPAVLRLLNLLGLLIIIIKILIPLILIIMCIKDCLKPIMSGKLEDLTGLLPTFVKRIIAGIIIFFIPGLVSYLTNNLVSFDDSEYKECTICLLEPNSCVIPKKDPETYKED